MRKINIILGDTVFKAELADTTTADKIWEALPMESAFNTWGDEIYFSIPVETGLDPTAREVVDLGDLAYWPSGSEKLQIAHARVRHSHRSRVRESFPWKRFPGSPGSLFRRSSLLGSSGNSWHGR